MSNKIQQFVDKFRKEIFASGMKRESQKYTGIIPLQKTTGQSLWYLDKFDILKYFESLVNLSMNIKQKQKKSQNQVIKIFIT